MLKKGISNTCKPRQTPWLRRLALRKKKKKRRELKKWKARQETGDADLSKIVCGEYHLLLHLGVKRELLIWRAAWIVVHSFNVTSIATDGNVVKTRNREALTGMGGGHETSL